MQGLFGNGVVILDMVLYVLIAIPILSVLAATATRSMNRRGATGWIFGLLVAFLPPVGLIVWALATALSAPPPRTHPSTGAPHLPE